jgi:hypothetical protein
VAQELLWRALNKLPPALHDPISRRLWGHSLYLTTQDYDFPQGAIPTAPVFLVRGSARP